MLLKWFNLLEKIHGFVDFMRNKTTPRVFRMYYFTRVEHLEYILRTGNIKVTQLGHSNDPFEYLPTINDAEEQEKWKSWMPEMAPCTICLSARMSSPVMWGHYAGHGKGICLAFDLPIHLISPSYKMAYAKNDNYKFYHCFRPNDTYLKLFEVVYSDTRLPINTVKGFTQKCTEDWEEYVQLFATKSSDWSYEKEFRLMINENELVADKGLLFSKVLTPYLSGIILGHECEYSYTYVKTLLKTTNCESIAVAKAALSPTFYKIYAMPIDGVRFEDTNIEDLHKMYYEDGLEKVSGSKFRKIFTYAVQYLKDNTSKLEDRREN